MIHNRRLPTWVHRLAQGLLSLAVTLTFVALAAPYAGRGPLSWLVFGLFFLSPVLAVLAAYLAPRHSLMEGIAGEDGYDELAPPTSEVSSGPA